MNIKKQIISLLLLSNLIMGLDACPIIHYEDKSNTKYNGQDSTNGKTNEKKHIVHDISRYNIGNVAIDEKTGKVTDDELKNSLKSSCPRLNLREIQIDDIDETLNNITISARPDSQYYKGSLTLSYNPVNKDQKEQKDLSKLVSLHDAHIVIPVKEYELPTEAQVVNALKRLKLNFELNLSEVDISTHSYNKKITIRPKYPLYGKLPYYTGEAILYYSTDPEYDKNQATQQIRAGYGIKENPASQTGIMAIEYLDPLRSEMEKMEMNKEKQKEILDLISKGGKKKALDEIQNYRKSWIKEHRELHPDKTQDVHKNERFTTFNSAHDKLKKLINRMDRRSDGL